jgi:hypothetical protein
MEQSALMLSSNGIVAPLRSAPILLLRLGARAHQQAQNTFYLLYTAAPTRHLTHKHQVCSSATTQKHRASILSWSCMTISRGEHMIELGLLDSQMARDVPHLLDLVDNLARLRQ